MYPLGAQSQQQRLGGVEIPVPAGHMGQCFHPQLPVDFTSQNAGVHSCPGNGAVGNGDNIRPMGLELPSACHEFCHISGFRRVQLHRNGLFPILCKFLPESVSLRLGLFLLRLYHGNLLGRVSAQGRCHRRQVLGGGTAAAAQDSNAHGMKLLHLSGKILRIPLIDGPAAQYRGITGIGHHRKRLIHSPQPLYQGDHMSCSEYAVESQRIHRRIFLRLVNQMGYQLTRTGKSVRLRGKGGDDKRLRLLFPNILGDFADAGKAAERLKQEIFCPKRQKNIHGEPIFLQRPLGIGHGHRAQVCKHKGIPRRFHSNAPARFYHLPAFFRSQCQPVRPKGIGFDGIAAGRKIGPMHFRHLLRSLEIGGFAAVRRAVILCHQIAAHGPVKN